MAFKKRKDLFTAVVPLLRGVGAVLAPLLLLDLPGSAIAQEARVIDPFRPFGEASFTYDTNYFRTEDDQEALSATGSDDQAVSYEQLTAGIDADIEFGLQTFVLRSEVFKQLFNRFSELNHVGYDVRAQLDWQIKDICSGDIGYRIDRTLTEFTELQSVSPNLRTRHNAYATPSCWVAPRWQVRGEFGGSSLRNSETAREFLDRDEVIGLVGADFVSRAGNRVGIEGEATLGEFPDRDAATRARLDDDFVQVRAAGVTTWTFRETIVLDGRLGFVHRDYGDSSGLDFYEVEGRLDGKYLLTAKTTLSAGVFREVVPIESIDANTRLNTGVAGGATWAPTDKIKLSAGLEYRTQDFSPENSPRDDDVVSADVKATYAPIEQVSIFAEFSARERESDKVRGDFSAQIISVGGRITF